MKNEQSAPTLSVVVIVYNMEREAPRTLFTLSAAYQKNIRPENYEVIIVDNGSSPPFDPGVLQELEGNFRLIRMRDASVSPVRAINKGISEARGNLVGVMIDGARMASPGMLSLAALANQIGDRAAILTLGFHLGFEVQMKSVREGYNQAVEDQLLAQAGWRENGYRLFDISVFAGSSAQGWFKPISESNALFLQKSFWAELGGFDERFQTPGGGLANLDILSRAVRSAGLIVTLLGEGTFHQVHGGVATNAIHHPWDTFAKEYLEIRGVAYEQPSYESLFFGSFSANVLPSIGGSARG
ncbi:glycosyltransferase family 2 protein [Methylocystis sp. JAN1]|uniref:glycosyltransferase family 2 protein n=1 Tax=Methylocystis sp. JAN1 TaxID=3397211 RepID=UPI003FA30146